MERITLREASDSDKALVFDLHERLFTSQIAEIWGWDTAQQIEIFEREWTASHVRVVECDRIFAGFIQQRDHEDHAYLLNFALDKTFQSRGIGSQLIELLKDESKQLSKALRLNVFRTNPRAQEFYRRHGFVVEQHGENGCTMMWMPSTEKKNGFD